MGTGNAVTAEPESRASDRRAALSPPAQTAELTGHEARTES
jgi:hypothetical protein